MKRFGLLPEKFDIDKDPFDIYESIGSTGTCSSTGRLDGTSSTCRVLCLSRRDIRNSPAIYRRVGERRENR